MNFKVVNKKNVMLSDVRERGMSRNEIEKQKAIHLAQISFLDQMLEALDAHDESKDVQTEQAE